MICMIMSNVENSYSFPIFPSCDSKDKNKSHDIVVIFCGCMCRKDCELCYVSLTHFFLIHVDKI